MCSLYVAILLLGKKSQERERERERARERERERESKEETVDEGSETDFFFDDSFHFLPLSFSSTQSQEREERRGCKVNSD